MSPIEQPATIAAAEAFFELLHGGAESGHLTICTFTSTGALESFWFPADRLDDAAAKVAVLTDRGRDVWAGVSLQGHTDKPGGRGANATVQYVPGLYMDLDVVDPQAHAELNLPPTVDAALDLFSEAFPLSPTLVVHSGHGLQAYWLFREPFLIETEDERAALVGMNQRLQRQVRAVAREHGWKIESTFDLARILRVPGSVNHKNTRHLVPVRVLNQSGNRYLLDDLDGYLPDKEPARTRPPHARSNGTHPPDLADIEPIMAGCGFMRHVRDDAKILPEPEWHAGISIIALCEDGDRIAHEFSKPYPTYTYSETQAKVDRARLEDKPFTCRSIRHDRSGEQWCSACPSWQKITSPIMLGKDGDHATFTMNGKAPHRERDTDDEQQSPYEANWPEMLPLPPLPSAPPLTDDMIPAAIRPWIVDIADITRMPLEMVAAPAIVGLGSVIGRAIGVRPWRFQSFTTVPNLWGIVAARPGWMKSFAVAEALSPVRRLAAQARERYAEEKESAAVELVALDAQLKAIVAKMAEAAKQGTALDDLKEKLREKRAEIKAAEPVERRYITHDATVEKLGELLRNNPRGILVERDEVYGLLRSFDKNGHENDRQFYLEAWSGTGSFTSDRIARGTVYIPALTVSVIGGIQPGRLAPLVNTTTGGGGDDDGLLQRFQLFVWPDKLGQWERPERGPDSAARDRAFSIFQKLDTLTPSSANADWDDDDGIPYLRFSHAAQPIADAWRDRLEHRHRSSELDAFPAFASHVGKYRSLMPALAGIFHLVNVVANDTPAGPIVETPTRLAIRWCDFLESHARKLYDAELDPGNSAARALAAKIKEGALHDGTTIRELYRRGWSGLTTDEAVIAGTTVLSTLGWVRIEVRSTGGRPGQFLRLHPKLCQLGTGG